MAREITWTCRCKRALTVNLDKFAWEVAECVHCGKTYRVEHIAATTQEMRDNFSDSFDALYIDGQGSILSATSTIFVLDTHAHIVLGESNNIVQFEIPYADIQSLNILQEREITALRTFLVGPVLAAWLKKKTQVLAVGYRDSLGLLQTPTFKVENSEIKKCYDAIMAQVARQRSNVEKR